MCRSRTSTRSPDLASDALVPTPLTWLDCEATEREWVLSCGQFGARRTFAVTPLAVPLTAADKATLKSCSTGGDEPAPINEPAPTKVQGQRSELADPRGPYVLWSRETGRR